MPALLPLAELPPDADAAFGGKAAGLARLLAAGARVPEGLALAAGTEALHALPAGDLERLRAALERLLAGGPIAVRSSAVGEDGTERSFAGLFESVLDVRTLEAALEAGERCRASGRGERVRAYAGDGPRAVGLVFQRLVPARSAGVCFTRDPAGRDAAVLVEAVAGAGDALVSGRAAPERWRVYENGFGRLEALREAGPAGVLDEGAAAALAAEARRLAERFGRPLDLEWARDERGSWWLQARPITAVAPGPPAELDVERASAGVDDGPVSVWANFNVRETLPEALTPLNWTLWRDVLLPAAGQPVFGIEAGAPLWREICPIDCIQGRAYWNMNALLALPLGRVFARGLGVIDSEAGEVTARLRRRGVLRARRLRGSRAVMAGRVLGASTRALLGILRSLRPEALLRRLEACARDVAARPDPAGLRDEELLREAALIGEPAAQPLHDGMRALGVGVVVYGFAQRAYQGHPQAQELLAAGIAGPTTRITLDLDGLLEAAQPLRAEFEAADPREAPALLAAVARHPQGAAFLERWREFLARHGQRCAGEFDLEQPRWRESPGFLLGLLKAGLLQPGPGGQARLEDVRRRRRAALDAATRASPPWVRPLQRFFARQVERFMPLREAPKHHGMEIFQRMRLALLELGRRLHARGELAATADLFLLEWEELQAAVRGTRAAPDRPTLAARRARLERLRRLDPPHFLRSDGVPVAGAEPPAEDGRLRGVGVSSGRARGPVRRLEEPDPARLLPGEVLLVRFADPGWTPLFHRAAALVMEVGGSMCHAAIVARELGVPAVFGVSGARARLADGTRVEVDGGRGLVTPLGEADPP